MNEKRTKQEILETLPHFYGTEEYHRYYTLFLTDGAYYLAEAAQCYWLFGIIWSIHPKIAEHGMVVCKLVVHEDRSAIFTAIGDGEALVHEQKIEWTDFPIDEITLYVADDVVMLPSEN